jgi:tetrameric-type glycyl-tRNA synthetase beta subunit
MVAFLDLPDREPDRRERELGPPLDDAYSAEGEPTEALSGFAERLGVAAGSLAEVQTERGVYLAAEREVRGRALAEVLTEIVPRVLGEIAWRREAGTGEPAWVRPLQSVVSLLDGEVVPFALGGLTAGRATAGHPILSPASFAVENLADYRRRLAELGIEVSLEQRRARLRDALAERAAEAGGELTVDPVLLDRLVLSCEIPGVVYGTFPAADLALPEEILLAALGQQQNAFAMRRRGELMASFLAVMDRPDDPRGAVRAGQERAVAGRLSDARFFYDNDRRTPLAERGRRLDQLSFHPRLGSWAEKTQRLRALVELICGELGWDDERGPALEAATLAKADLTTDLVRELPGLKGTVGGLYAREEGCVGAVWQAIYDQYRPGSRESPIPRGPAGRLLAVADRLDTLVGFLGIGPRPSASKDPFALRRLAHGLLSILLDGGMELDLDLVAARAALAYGDSLEVAAEEVLERLQGLLADRVAHLLGRRGFARDEIEAAMAVGKKNLPDLAARVAALHEVRGSGSLGSLIQAARRIANIVKDSPEVELAEELLVEEAEIELYRRLSAVRKEVNRAAEERRYGDCLGWMSELVPALDRFFADVLVMDEDQTRRQNRVALLQSCRRVFWRIARLQKIVVERPEAAGE